MLISWIYEQIKHSNLTRDDQDIVIMIMLGALLFIMVSAVSFVGFGLTHSIFLVAGFAVISFMAVVVASIIPQEGLAPKVFMLYLAALYFYIGLVVGLIQNIYPLSLALLVIILVGEEAIFWLDSQKRPVDIDVFSFTALKKLDALNDVFIGLGAYGLIYEITGGIKPAAKSLESFSVAAAPWVAGIIIVVGGVMALLFANSFKYGGPFAREAKTPNKNESAIIPENNVKAHNDRVEEEARKGLR